MSTDDTEPLDLTLTAGDLSAALGTATAEQAKAVLDAEAAKTSGQRVTVLRAAQARLDLLTAWEQGTPVAPGEEPEGEWYALIDQSTGELVRTEEGHLISVV